MELPKRPKTTKKRSHLPSLNAARLANFKAQLEQLAIPRVAQEAVMQSMVAATNPQAETPENVIASLESEIRERVKQSMAGYKTVLSGMNARGRMALSLMSDAEFAEKTGIEL